MNSFPSWLANLDLFTLVQHSGSSTLFSSGNKFVRFVSVEDNLDMSADGRFTRGTISSIELLNSNMSKIESLVDISVDAQNLSADDFANAIDILGLPVHHEIVGNVQIVTRPSYGALSYTDLFHDDVVYKVGLTPVKAGLGFEDTIDFSGEVGTGTGFDGYVVDLRTGLDKLENFHAQRAGVHGIDERGKFGDPNAVTLQGINHATGSEGGDYLIGREWQVAPIVFSSGGQMVSRSGSTLKGLDGDDILVNGYEMHGGRGDDLIALGDYGIALE